MLKNLSIRDRLMLILLGPLVVLLAIAALAVRDNLDTSSVTNDAAYRVEMAQVTSRLFDAVRQEAAANQGAVAESGVDLTEARTATDEAALAWRERVERFSDLDVDGLEGQIANLAAHRELVSPNFATGAIGAGPVYDLDISLLERIVAFDGRLNGRGESVASAGLLRASQLTDASLAAADAQLLGLWAAHTGQVSSFALASQIDASGQVLESYSNRAPADMQVAASDDYDALAGEFADALPGDPVSIEVGEWSVASEERAAAIEDAKQALLLETGQEVNDEAGSARSNMRNIGLLALAGLLIGAAILYLVVRSIRGSLQEISAEADALARNDLPKLAQALAAGRPIGAHEERPLLDTSGNDEISDVADSLNEIRRSASNVAQQQTDLLQSGIAEMFVNLARRNQTLVDRQLEVIDDLEAQERDADRLSQLYRVDHLATRMRRNAESLLVLADNTTPRRRGEPIDLREVVRVAIGEVEDYRRIVPIALDDLKVAAHVAPDVAHLLSELMENATQSSPPGTVADVVGVTEPDASYTVHVMDRGTGIDDDRRNHLNRVLAEPPTNTLSMSKTLGLTVVGRLAQRMGLEVTLNPGTDGGTVASVTVPADVVADWAGSSGLPAVTRTGLPAADRTAEPATPEPAPLAPNVEPEPAPTFDPVSAEHPIPQFDQPESEPVEPQVYDAPEPDPVAMDLAALQDLAPLTEAESQPAASPEAPEPQVSSGDGIAGLPPFPTLGPPEDEVPTAPSALEEPVAPPLQSDLPADDAFGLHEEIPAVDAEFAPPPSITDVFGGVVSDEAPTPDSPPEAPAFEPELEAPSFEQMPEAPSTFDPVSEAPAFEQMPEAPSTFEQLSEAPAFEQVPEAPTFEPVPEAPTFGQVPEPETQPIAPVGEVADASADAALGVPFDHGLPEEPEVRDPGEVFTWPEEASDETAPSPSPIPATDYLASPPAPPADPFAEVAPTPEAPTSPAHAAPGSGPVDATPAPIPPRPVEPAHAPPVPETTPVPAHAGLTEVPPTPEAPTTAAGLVKRRRGESSIDDSAGPSGDRTAPSKRSPDQVKNMLSRYKTGLQRGRDVTEGEGQS